jgi:hypothetical protein
VPRCDLVEGRLELARVLVDDVLVHDAVVHHDRQAVDEAFLGNGADFVQARRRWSACRRTGRAGRRLGGLGDGVVLLAAAGQQRRRQGDAQGASQQSVFGYLH